MSNFIEKSDFKYGFYHSSTSLIANGTDNQPDTAESSTVLYKTLVYGITIPLFFLTTVGNGVILLTIKFQARLLSSNSNYFILSLAFADFFVGIAIMPVMILYTANQQIWKYSILLCDSWMSLDFLCSSASFLTLSTMSLERYKMLTNSYAHIRYSSKMRIYTFISLSWLLPIFTWLPLVIIHRLRTTSTATATEVCDLAADKYIILVMCILVYHIPLVCMVVFYTKLIVYIKKSSNTNLEPTNSQLSIFTASQQLQPNKRLLTTAGRGFSFNSNNNMMIMMNNYNYNGINGRYSSNPNETRLKTKREMFKKSHSLNSNNRYLLTMSGDRSSTLLSKLSVILPCCFLNQRASPDTLKRSMKSSNLGNLNARRRASSAFVNSAKRPSHPESIDDERCVFTIHSKNNNNNNTTSGVDEYDHAPEIKIKRGRSQSSASNSAAVDKDAYSSDMTSKAAAAAAVANAMGAADRRFSQAKKKDSTSGAGLYDGSNYQNLRLKRNRKAARMLGILVAAFSFCWLPFTVIYPLSKFYPNVLPSYATIVIWWLGYLNSTINPFLYVYSNKNIRRSVRILFCKRLWAYFTGNRVNGNFRSDSIKNNQALVGGANNIYKRSNCHRQLKLHNLNNLN